MFYVEFRKLHEIGILKFLIAMLLNFYLGGCDLHRKYGIVVILLPRLRNYDNLILKLHEEKRRYPMKDEFLLTDSKLPVEHCSCRI